MGAAPDARRCRSRASLATFRHRLEGFASHRGWCSLPALRLHPNAGGSPFPRSQPAAAAAAHPGAGLLLATGAHRVGKPAPCNAPLSPTALKQRLFLQQSSIFVTLILIVFFTGAGLAQMGRRAALCLLRSAAHGDHGRGSRPFPNKTTRTNSVGNKFLASK